jgi:lipoprotein-anchoring transpeptidase ErfK/SrfK
LTAHDAARSEAEAALLRAESVLGQAGSLLDDVPLRSGERESFRAAKTELATSRRLWQDDSYLAARDHADRAVERARAALAGAGSMASRFADGEQVRRWRRWIEETVAWSRSHKAPAIIVNKERNRLELYSKGRLVRSYRADMGSNNTHTKLVAGDRATPEGRYRIVEKKNRSTYYKALLLDYPNEDDRKRFSELVRQGRVSPHAGLGSLIEIHGEGGRGSDWTKGCVALSNADMDELFARASVGTPVTIVGGDGSSGRLSQLARRLAATSINGASP